MKTIPSIIERVCAEYDEKFHEAVYTYPYSIGKRTAREDIKQFISQALTSAIEEVGDEIIGSDDKRSEQLIPESGVLIRNQDDRPRNELRAEQRKKLSQLLGRV